MYNKYIGERFKWTSTEYHTSFKTMNHFLNYGSLFIFNMESEFIQNGQFHLYPKRNLY